MTKTIKVLCVHGLGDQRQSQWKEHWERAVTSCFDGDSSVTLEFRFVTYDPIFAKTDISFGDTVTALWKLGRSALPRPGRPGRAISDIPDRLRWTAGYVVAWVADEGFQAQTRKLILDEVHDFKPDVILAHSLGSLVTYNAFSHKDASEEGVAKALAAAHYVTLGSQIGNPFVIGNLSHGRIQPLAVRHWHHLFNEHDDVFTAPIKLQGVPTFTQLLTPFDLDGSGDHAATSYITHMVTIGSLWRPLALRAVQARASSGSNDPWRRAPQPDERPSRRRALLVGINDYPREADRLGGCVNDVFTMSAVLQECGFTPDEVRTCLDDRATAKGILERLEWLLDDVQPGDQRVFYYSGHGARVPEYGLRFEPDRLTETLVPWDFDWTPETSISDEQIYDLYSQLPYDAQLVFIFDCCHAGGIHRQNGARARGIAPPDDIRHRQLKWDREAEMWIDRNFDPLNPEFSTETKPNAAFFGPEGATVRIGRGALLRKDSAAQYRRARESTKAPVGPYLPLIIEACDEDELSYEYRHGATSYGAFTFCLASILREEKTLSFERLVSLTRDRLAELRYEQVPQILGPTALLAAEIPWETGTKPLKTSRRKPGTSTPRLSG